MTTIRIADSSIKDVARTLDKMTIVNDMQDEIIKTYDGRVYGRISTIKSEEFKNNLNNTRHAWIRLVGSISYHVSSSINYILRKDEDYFVVTL